MNSSFEQLFSNIKTSNETIEMREVIDQQKKDVISFIHTHIGKSVHERKPAALKQFEKGFQKYFFGVNGLIARKRRQQIQSYSTKPNKINYHNSFLEKCISPLITPQTFKSKLKQKIRNSSCNTVSHSHQLVRKSTNKISLQAYNTNSNKHTTHNDVAVISSPRRIEPLYKSYLKNSKSLSSLTKATNSTTFTNNNTSSNNNTNSIGLAVSFNKTPPYLRSSLSDKQMKIQQELITMNNSRKLLESKLFRIADNAYVHDKTLKYLKSNVQLDLEALSDKHFMSKPSGMYNTKMHFRDSQKTIEIIDKYSKDVMAYEVNFTLDQNPKLIRMWKTKRKVKDNVTYNSNLRQKVEKNYRLIQKWKYNMDVLKDELIHRYNEVNISNKQE